MFDYYYGSETEQFSFYRIPKLLIKDKKFKKLSSDAKILYGLMLDRMALSMKNGWLDDYNRAYIYYSVDDIAEDLGCSKPTCTKIMAELDSKKGIGLIEKKRQGQGKPDIIYVKNFVSMCDRENLNYEQNGDSLPVSEIKDFNIQKSNNLTSKSKEFESLEVKNFNPNYTNINNTNYSYNNHINPNLDNAKAYMKIIKKNIGYEYHMDFGEDSEKRLVDEIYNIICDVVCIPKETVRIGKIDYPYELVKSRFLKLNHSHIEYVKYCMSRNTTHIQNIKAYLLTVLYNAPNTMNHFYQQEVQCNMYGDSGQFVKT